jgi:uncharacterized protein
MNFKPLILSIVAVLASVISQIVYAEPATEKTVRELLTLTGSGKMGVQMIDNIIPAFKKMIPKAPDAFWTEFLKEINAEDLNKLTIPIYQANFSEEDLKVLITFYSTPVGQRILATLPVVLQESMKAGQQWGQELGRRALERAAEQQLIPAK